MKSKVTSSGLGMKLTTHLHLVPTLRMSGTIPPLPQYITANCLIKQEIHIHGMVRFKEIKDSIFWHNYTSY